jgi:hypothetical protein
VHQPRTNPTVANPDFNFENHGSLALLRPLTESARVWIDENVSHEGFQPYWPTVIVESRYCGDLLAGIADAGLGVRL